MNRSTVLSILILSCVLGPRVTEAQPAAGGTSETSNATRGTGCPGDGSCCIEHGPGCNDVLCCLAVCDFDPTCCEVVWDTPCVLAAHEHCGELCGGPACPGSGDCCANHGGLGCADETCCTLVCDERPSCCTGSWSNACVALAVELCSCQPVARCPRPGTCCFGHPGSTGCEREACCEIICTLDSYCCKTDWDSQCGSMAQIHCPNVCACPLFGDFDESTAIDLLDFAAFQLCFTGEDGGPVAVGCACSDYDGDDDADLSDFAHYGL